MKTTISVAVDEDLLKKARKKADDAGISFSEFTSVALMAMVDKGALIKHTGVLLKQLGILIGENYEKKLSHAVGVEFVEGEDGIKQKA